MGMEIITAAVGVVVIAVDHYLLHRLHHLIIEGEMVISVGVAVTVGVEVLVLWRLELH